MSDIDKAPAEAEGEAGTPPELRFLKALVTILAGTMILGLITIIALIVIRFPRVMQTGPVLPAAIELPEGASARAVTFGTGWVAVVTDGDEILIFDAKTNALRQRLRIDAQ